MTALPEPASAEVSVAVDPITLEVLRHRLWTINDEQGKVAIQISGSPTVYEGKDLNAAILTPEGNSLFVGVYTTRVALCADVAVKYIIEHFSDAPGIGEGDAFITNDPWTGAGHQNDFMVLAPIFAAGECVAWSGIAMHDVDVGGPTPGNFTVGARTVFDEAPLIPPVRLVEGGVVRSDIEALVLRNSRTPELNALNIRARLAAVNRTVERINDIVEEYGKDVFLSTQAEILALVRRGLARRLRACPDGTWRAEGYLDHDGNNDTLYPIRVSLTKQDDRLIFDYTGTSEQVEGPINCTWVGMQCGVVSAVLSTLCYDMPWAPGAFFDLFEIRAPDGLINRANYPAAVGIATISGVYATQHVAHAAIVKMLASADNRELRSEAQANWTSSAQVTGVSGLGRGGQWFAAMLMDQAGGAGAAPDRDGTDSGGIPGSPSQAIANIERYEQQYPLLYVYRKQCRDTAGAGRFRGGVGTEALLMAHGSGGPLDFTVVCHGAAHPESAGLLGGTPGSVQAHLLFRDTDVLAQFNDGRLPVSHEELGYAEQLVLAAKDRGVLNPGDALLAVANGGGGFGDPLLRSAHAVCHDLSLDLCSPTTVRDVYGVVVDDDGTLNQTETDARRQALRAARLAEASPADPASAESASLGQDAIALDRSGDHETCYVRATHDGVVVHACSHCGTVYGPIDKDPKRFALVREVPVASFSEWNRFAAPGKARVFEFYCRGCAVMIATQVRRADETIYWDMSLQAASSSTGTTEIQPRGET